MQLNSAIKDLRNSLKDNDEQAERKRRELMEKCSFLDG